MAEEKDFVALPTSADRNTPDLTIADVLKVQYLSTDTSSIFGATELREHEIPLLATSLMNEAVLRVLSTSEIEEPGDENYPIAHGQMLALKRRVLSNPNAMVLQIYTAWNSAFGLLRKSLKRASREEGVRIATASITRAYAGDEVGIGQQLLGKFGLGKYKTAYIPKEKGG